MTVGHVSFGRLARSMRNGVLTLSAVTHGQFDATARKHASFGHQPREEQKVRPGMFLICRGNGNAGLVGSGVVVPGDVADDLVFPDTIIGVELDEAAVDSSYLFHAWRTPEVRSQINAGARTTNGTHKVNQQVLEAIRVPLPPLPEQRRIAAILDEADALRRKRREARGLLDDLLRSAFLEMFGDPVTNPRGWPTVRLDEVADIASGVTKGRKFDGRPTVMVPYMRVANVQDGHVSLDDVKDVEVLPDDVNRYRLYVGDVLLTEGGDPDKLGRGAVWYGQVDPCIHQNHIFRVRCDRAKVLPEYVSRMLGSELGKRYFARAAKQTTGIASINMTQLRGAPVRLAPIDVQRRWDEFVREHRREVERAEVRGREVDALFATLLERAFRAPESWGDGE
jgi:type I restriction enzyme S subunit